MAESLAEKAFLAGLGVFGYARENIKEFVGDLIKHGEASRAEGKKLVEDLAKKGKEERKFIARAVKEVISKTSRVMNVASATKQEELEKKVDNIEARVTKLEADLKAIRTASF